MRKPGTLFTPLVAALAFLTMGSLLVAQDTSSSSSAQSETKSQTTTKTAAGEKKTTRSHKGAVSGEVTAYEEGKSITVKGPKADKTVDIDAATKVTAKDIKEGTRVRVSWKEKDGKEVAVRISGLKARKAAKTSPKTSEPAPKTD